MSYYQPQPTKNRTALWVALAVVLVALLAVGAYVLGRNDRGAAPASGPAASTAPAISWSTVGGQPVPASPVAGPRNTDGGRATGFSHNALGAALAAVNISFRLASEVGPQVYEATAREQCFGDVDTEIQQIRNSSAVRLRGPLNPVKSGTGWPAATPRVIWCLCQSRSKPHSRWREVVMPGST